MFVKMIDNEISVDIENHFILFFFYKSVSNHTYDNVNEIDLLEVSTVHLFKQRSKVFSISILLRSVDSRAHR